MNNFFATGLRVILAVLMIFQSIFAPITYAFMMPEIDNQEIEQGIDNTVTQELITIPSVPGYEGSGGEKEMEEVEEVEEVEEIYVVEEAKEVEEVKEEETGINDIFIQKSEGVREYITLVNDTPEGIKKRALTILELEDIFLSGLVISDLGGFYFDNAIVFEGGKTIILGLNAEFLEAYIQSQGDGEIDTGGLEDGIQENVFEIILPTSEVKTDVAGRFVLESVESVNVLSNQYQYCSLLSRTNLERLTEALQSKEIIIYQGDAITLIEEGIKNKSLQEYSKQGLSDFFAKQKYQTVFDLYMYTPIGDSNGDEENYEAYINQGHRVVVFQATDQQRYVLDTLRGKKTITPQLLSDYLSSNEFDQSILYLRTEGYGKGYAPIEVHNASQFVVYAGQGKIAAEFNDLGLPIAARFNVPFVFLPEENGPKVTLPQGVYVRTKTGEPFAITSLGLTELILSDLNDENIDITQVKGSVEFGIPGQGLLFDRPVQIEIPVDLPDGSSLEVKVKHGDADNFGIEGITKNPDATCVDGISSDESNTISVMNGKAVFWTCAASTFVINALGSSNLKLWLKANSGTSCSTNNCVLTGWNDQSGLGNNATGAGTSLPRYISSFRNFNPAILFTGGYFHTLNDGGVQDDMTLIAVYSSVQSGGDGTFWNSPALIGAETNAGQADYALGMNVGRLLMKALDGDGLGTVETTTSRDGFPQIGIGTRARGGNSIVYRNGIQVATGASDATGLSLPTKFGIGNHDVPSAGGQFSGYIMEAIVYSGILSSTNRNKIDSYLGIKYGIRLTQTTPTNYTLSGGQIVWQASENGVYSGNIAGIARDDGFSLSQLQSRSATNSGDVIGRVSSLGTDALALLWSNNGGTTGSWSLTEAPGGYQRIAREWRISEKNGDVGSVTFTIPTNGISSSGGSIVSMLVAPLSSSGDFTSGTVTAIAGIVSGGTYVFTGNFLDGDYFTFGIPYTFTGGANKLYRFMASSGTTLSGSLVSGRRTQTTPSYTLIQLNNVNRPQYVSENRNFWPGVSFNGAADSSYQVMYSVAGPAFSTNPNLNAFIVSTASGSTDRAVIGFAFNFAQTRVKISISNNSFGWYRENETLPLFSGSSSSFGIVNMARYGTLYTGWNNGQFVKTGTNINTFQAHTTEMVIGGRGYSSNDSQYFQGVLNEVILYSGSVSVNEKQIIDSYLALKYGITLPAQNYILSNNTVIWNYGANSSYHTRVFGISRDTTLNFDQRIAQSTSTTGVVLTFSNGTGFVASQTGATQLANNSAIVFGDDAGTTGVTLLSGVTYKLNRSWKVSEIGTVGTGVMRVDASLFTGTSQSMLVSSDSTFDMGDTFVSLQTGDATYKYFAYDFSHNTYFTFVYNSGTLQVAPVAVNDTGSTNEDTTGALSVLSNDTDANGDTLSLTGVTSVTGGTAIASGTQVRFVPTPDFCGTGTFTYMANDGTANSNVATGTVSITCFNDGPLAVNDSVSTSEDSTGAFSVLNNDTDVDGDTLSLIGVTSVTGGSATASGTQVRFVPTPDFCGTGTFTYRANDGSANSNVATGTVTITCVNDSPVAVNDTGIIQQWSTGLFFVLGNDTDVEGNVLSITGLTLVTGGQVSISGTGVLFTGSQTFCGTGVFTYQAYDGTITSNVATGNITVLCDSTPPVVTLNGSGTVTVAQGGSYSEQGADWTDNVDGSGSAMISGIVNTGVVGTYVLEYTYTDTAGNTGNIVMRTVSVVDINECILNTDNCVSGEICGNTIGGFTCTQCGAGTYQTGDSCVSCSPGSSSTTGATSCTMCSAGTSQPNSGATSCDVCAPGRISTTGAVVCTPCAIGSYGSGNECVSCSSGTYGDQTGMTSCNACPGGTYSAGTGSTSCIACSGGSYSDTGASSCVSCLPGTYQANAQAISCDTCASGYESSTGATSCTDIDECVLNTDNCDINATCTNTGGSFTCGCNVGFTGNGIICTDNVAPIVILNGSLTITINQFDTYTESGADWTDNVDGSGSTIISGSVNTGVVGTYVLEYTYTDTAGNTGNTVTRTVSVIDINECVLNIDTCTGGSVCSNTIGSFTCTTCAGGTYQTGDSCISCNPGTSSSTGATSCSSCSAGTYQAATGASSCDACTPGSTSITGAISCTLCPLGTFGSGNACLSCSSGTYGNLQGMTSCNSCPQGTYQPATGQMVCYRCDAGSFQNTTGSDSCTLCSPGTYQSNQQALSCDTCAPGTISSTGATTCTLCDAGTYATGNSCLSCASGFESNTGATACTDIDECDLNTDNCDIHATCTNTAGSFTCGCNVGFSGDGIFCIDSQAPIVTLLGSGLITLEYGQNYTELGAEWTDYGDGTGNAMISGSVNTGVLGTYLLEYTYVDGGGNTGNTVTRMVTIVDTTPPVLTLLGSGTVTIAQFSPYNDSGALRTDAYDGTGLILVATSGSVNTGVIGTYLLEYTYVDSNGNTGNTVSRTVSVIFSDLDGDGLDDWSEDLNNNNDLTDDDSDNDGTPDYLDDDDDNDGMTSAAEGTGDLDGDTIPNYIDDDDDADGVLSLVENNGPNNGDGNDDGINDSLQIDVATIPNAENNDYFTLELPTAVSGADCSTISVFTALSESSLPEQDALNYPLGLNEFEIPCSGSVTITLYYHETVSLSPYTYKKYGPTIPGSGATSVWYLLNDVTPVTIGTSTVGGQTVGTVTFTLTDGLPGDDTGVDGLIVDANGPGILPAPTGGGGGGSSLYTPVQPTGGIQIINTPGSNQTGTEQPVADDQITFVDNAEPIIYSPSDIFNSSFLSENHCFQPRPLVPIQSGFTSVVTAEFLKSLSFLSAFELTKFNQVDPFEPYSTLTRAQAAKFLVQFAENVLCRKPDLRITQSYKDFTDTDSTLQSYVLLAKQHSIMKGSSDGYFYPNAPITRAQFTSALIRLAINGYLDESQGQNRWTNYESVAKQLGIINYAVDNNFSILRNDAALILFRTMKNQVWIRENEIRKEEKYAYWLSLFQ